MRAPICSRHDCYMVAAGLDAFYCVQCEGDTTSPPLPTPVIWRQDEEADVNDAHTRHDHIYPKLHGTGGIGPGGWQRQALALAQERNALKRHITAGRLVNLCRMADLMNEPAETFSLAYDRLIRSIIREMK